MSSDDSFKRLNDAGSAYRVSSQTYITSMEIIRGVWADTDLTISLLMFRCYSYFAAQWPQTSTPAGVVPFRSVPGIGNARMADRYGSDGGRRGVAQGSRVFVDCDGERNIAGAPS